MAVDASGWRSPRPSLPHTTDQHSFPFQDPLSSPFTIWNLVFSFSTVFCCCRGAVRHPFIVQFASRGRFFFSRFFIELLVSRENPSLIDGLVILHLTFPSHRIHFLSSAFAPPYVGISTREDDFRPRSLVTTRVAVSALFRLLLFSSWTDSGPWCCGSMIVLMVRTSSFCGSRDICLCVLDPLSLPFTPYYSTTINCTVLRYETVIPSRFFVWRAPFRNLHRPDTPFL